MPDGDVVRSEMPRLFISPFRSLYQGQVPVDELKREFVKATLLSIKRFGDGPVNALLEAAPSLDVLLHVGFMATAADHAAADVAEERIRRGIQNPDAATVATRAFGITRAQIDSGDILPTADLRVELLTNFAHCLYDHQCHCRIPYAVAEHPDADIDQVRRSADELRTVLHKEISRLGQYLARHGTTEGMTMPRAAKLSDEISAEDYL